MLDRIDETIVAVSSAPGRGPLGILRLAGPTAIEIVDRFCERLDARRLSEMPTWTRSRGQVLLDDYARVPADFYLFRAPRSYTRQDLVEIHTIGSPPLLEIIRKRALDFGARPAEPGEFTARAFLNGRLDLASAEAVAGIVRAQSDTQLRAARRMMDGALARRIRETRDELGELLALVEADIDFAEEPIEFITPPELVTRLRSVRGKLDALTAGGLSVERLEVLPRILLFGPPNAGKSTLMNRLSGTDRAICAAVAGTTRDILSAPVQLGRIEAVLLDAAGIDPAQDEIIAQARAMALSEAERVDALCIVLDVTAPLDPAFVEIVRSLPVPRRLVAANKCDLLPHIVPTCNTNRSDPTRDDEEAVKNQSRDRKGAVSFPPNQLRIDLAPVSEPCSELEARLAPLGSLKWGDVIAVSAHTSEGIDALRATLADLLSDQSATTLGESILLTERQHAALRAATDALGRAESLAHAASETIDSADLLAFELRESLDALATLTGELTTEDLLSQVFAKFCIGK